MAQFQVVKVIRLSWVVEAKTRIEATAKVDDMGENTGDLEKPVRIIVRKLEE